MIVTALDFCHPIGMRFVAILPIRDTQILYADEIFVVVEFLLIILHHTEDKAGKLASSTGYFSSLHSGMVKCQ